MLRLRGLLDFEQIGVVDLAAVGPDGALAEQWIVSRHLLHLGDHRLAVLRAFECRDRLEVMRDARIDAGLHHGWELTRPLPMPALGPGAVGIVHVPIPGLRQGEALRRRETERVHIACEHEQARELLPPLDHDEFGALRDRVDGVAARSAAPDALGLLRLRLQQERRETAGIERMANLPEYL